MKKWLRNLGVVVAVLVTVLFATTLYYYMPRAVKVTISGTEVKRMDQKGGTADESKTRDVRFVYATTIDTKKALAFRNEDNPWYFKFDSGNVAAEAASVVQEDKNAVVLLKYYGERIPLFHMYPNIISLKKVEADYVHIPIFNIVFLIVLLIVFIWAGAKTRKLFHAAKEKTQKLVSRDET